MLSKAKAPAQVWFWGIGQEKKPTAKNMYRCSAIELESSKTDR
jgi:hypothetical protein